MKFILALIALTPVLAGMVSSSANLYLTQLHGSPVGTSSVSISSRDLGINRLLLDDEQFGGKVDLSVSDTNPPPTPPLLSYIPVDRSRQPLSAVSTVAAEVDKMAPLENLLKSLKENGGRTLKKRRMDFLVEVGPSTRAR